MATLTREEEIKTKICREYFSDYEWKIIGNIDLTIASRTVFGTPTTFLWAETKRGTSHSIYESLIQLILTVGKARTYEKEMPPYYLGAADAEKIAFVEFSEVMHIFTKTDFNWNVTPSDHSTKEFKELYALLSEDLKTKVLIFKFAFDEPILKRWIRKNFKEGRKFTAKIPVNKNNFTFVYYDWVKSVKPSIIFDWTRYANKGVLDCDFFLADLMSVDDISLRERLKVVLEKTKYKVLQNIDGDDLFQEIDFNDGMAAYRLFWNRYERPPKPVYQRYILDRHDLLVPQFIREKKGSYYTPEIWARKAQEYLEKTLGENWQDEYYVWDCSAGSGNLLRGLTNKYNIFASTLDDSDVKVMHDAIDDGRLNLVKNNVFQFDFLNDTFDKCPDSLRKILNDPEKRKHLVLFNNPPYRDQTKDQGEPLPSRIRDEYLSILGTASRELYAQFLIRFYKEIPGSQIAIFSKLKLFQGSDFGKVRQIFKAKLLSMFVVPGKTFDNIDGNFPIGFQIWDTSRPEEFRTFETDAFSKDGAYLGTKTIYLPPSSKEYISNWVVSFKPRAEEKVIGWMEGATRNDFQNVRYIHISNVKSASNSQPRGVYISESNIIENAISFAVREVIPQDWLNDRDQFLVPKDGWQSDIEFQSDCLIYMLFHSQNRISCTLGVNHWIPFYEREVNSPGTFDSRFMADYIHGRYEHRPLAVKGDTLFDEIEAEEASKKIIIESLSAEARTVYEIGKELWKYYMSKPDVEPNASLYDIKGYFQGQKTTKGGKEMMNSYSTDTIYTEILERLKDSLRVLGRKIEPKVFEYGFLYD